MRRDQQLKKEPLVIVNDQAKCSFTEALIEDTYYYYTTIRNHSYILTTTSKSNLLDLMETLLYSNINRLRQLKVHKDPHIAICLEIPQKDIMGEY